MDSHLRYDTLKLNQIVGPPICPVSAKEGDPCVVIYGVIKNEYDKDYYICISADIYNSKGEKVGQIVDPPVCAFTVVHVRAGDTGYFELHVKYDKRDVARCELFAFICDMPPP